MKKINWFARLFMSWKALEEHFGAQTGDTRTLEVLEKNYQQMIDVLNTNISNLNSQLSKASEQVTRLEEQNLSKDRELNKERNDLSDLKLRLQEVKVQLDERTNESKNIKDEIRDQLKTINKIERTFFSTTGNKGKGELGEQQVKRILEKAGIGNDMWFENLTVGKDTVEFAISSGEEGKFIPVDSKVLDADLDEDGKVIIDDKYKAKVKSAAKDVAKYLGKANTTDYGILVLQSDSIYMKLFEEYPTFFQEMIQENKVHINSPSSFVQTAWSISHLMNIYRRVHNDEKIYDQMVSTIESVSKFANSLMKVHKDFNVTMRHYGTIENKSTKLLRKLNKDGKIKELPQIEFNDQEE